MGSNERAESPEHDSQGNALGSVIVILYQALKGRNRLKCMRTRFSLSSGERVGVRAGVIHAHFALVFTGRRALA